MEKRKFSPEEKYKILEEVHAPAASIAEVCRRHQMAPSLVYSWERQAKQGAIEALKGKGNGRKKDREADYLRDKIQKMRSVISEITEENLVLKKRIVD